MAVRVERHRVGVHVEVVGVVEDAVVGDYLEVFAGDDGRVRAAVGGVDRGEAVPGAGERLVGPVHAIVGGRDLGRREEVDGCGVVVSDGGVDKPESVEEAVGCVEVVEDFGPVDHPDVVGDDVAGVDGEGRVQFLDGLDHALLEAQRRVAFRVAEWAAWARGVARRVFLGVDPAADGLGAVVVRACFVGQVHVGVADMGDADGRLSAWRRAGFGRFRAQCEVVFPDLGIIAETNQTGA